MSGSVLTCLKQPYNGSIRPPILQEKLRLQQMNLYRVTASSNRMALSGTSSCECYPPVFPCCQQSPGPYPILSHPGLHPSVWHVVCPAHGSPVSYQAMTFKSFLLRTSHGSQMCKPSHREGFWHYLLLPGEVRGVLGLGAWEPEPRFASHQLSGYAS